MIAALLAGALTSVILAQAAAPQKPGPAPGSGMGVEALQAAPKPTTPTDDFGPDLKAWLDATKLQDKDSAARALASLQRRRAERNLASVDEIAGAISGRAEVRAAEGSPAEAVEMLGSAIGFAPDSATYHARRAALEGKLSDAWRVLDLAGANPFEEGRLLSALLLGVLIVGALLSVGFSLGILLRYGAVFSHDVAEGLPAPLKSLALFMAVLFLALPLAGFMGWGYLPFWWVTLLFIFQSRSEKIVSVALLAGLALSSLALPFIMNQRAVEGAREGRQLQLLASGGTSVEGEALSRERLMKDPSDVEWSLLSASLSRRGGRFDEAAAALQAQVNADPRFAHNAAALELSRLQRTPGNFEPALNALTAASAASLSNRDKATALYNLSLAEVNSLKFEQSKDSRKKADAIDAPLLARYDRLFSFDRAGSTLQAPPAIDPLPGRIVGSSLPLRRLTFDNATSRLTFVAIALLLFIPGIVKVRGVQSFSKQCPKCGTTFCWLCQTRSTSQDVCSQCHHLFVVKRGIPPNARAAKNAEITQYVTRRALLHRAASLAAPGSGHLSVGHFSLGLALLVAWAIAAGTAVTVHFLAPLIVAESPLGSTIKLGMAFLALLTYVIAQIAKPRPPVVAVVRRVRPEPEA